MLEKLRADQLIKIRPVIPMAKLKEGISNAEKFQNQTLRPIIKFQHHLLIAVFDSYLEMRKLKGKVAHEKLIEIIDKAFTSDNQFKSKIFGIVIGHFTKAEFEVYSSFSSEINKRISQIIRERLISHVDLF